MMQQALFNQLHRKGISTVTAARAAARSDGVTDAQEGWQQLQLHGPAEPPQLPHQAGPRDQQGPWGLREQQNSRSKLFCPLPPAE